MYTCTSNYISKKKNTVNEKKIRPYMGKFIVVYFDDRLIYSKREDEHLEHLEKVFETLRREKLYAQLKKCIHE